MLRTIGKRAAAIAFAGDFSRACSRCWSSARRLGDGNTWLELIAAIAAVLGHSYSVFIGFKGGRGVVTGFGATIVAAPVPMLVAFVVGLILVALTRYVSLGSVGRRDRGRVAACARSRCTRANAAWAVWGVLIRGFIVVAHRDNIERLLAGTERKLGEPAVFVL